MGNCNDIVTCLQRLKILNDNLMIQMKDLNCWVEYGSDLRLVQETVLMSETTLPLRFDLESDKVLCLLYVTIDHSSQDRLLSCIIGICRIIVYSGTYYICIYK